jgi:hypothetical protein
MSVEYRPIPSLPGYLAGSDGTIIGRRGIVLKLCRNRKGYLHFWAKVNGRELNPGAHAAVCEAFSGARPVGYDCAHLNGNPGDNRPENLQWKTRKDNHADKRLHGTHLQGERISWAKLTEDDVRKIRKTPGTTTAVGAMFGVSPATIWLIRSGRNWRHVV